MTRSGCSKSTAKKGKWIASSKGARGCNSLPSAARCCVDTSGGKLIDFDDENATIFEAIDAAEGAEEATTLLILVLAGAGLFALACVAGAFVLYTRRRRADAEAEDEDRGYESEHDRRRSEQGTRRSRHSAYNGGSRRASRRSQHGSTAFKL